MKIKLPVQTKEMVTIEESNIPEYKGEDENEMIVNAAARTLTKKTKMVIHESEQEFDLDMSIAAQIRFETKFPTLAEREDLLGYSQRIFEINDLSLGLIISKLKMIYCWFDTEMVFNDFLKLFDLSDEAYMKKLIKALNDTFEIVADGSAEKN